MLGLGLGLNRYNLLSLRPPVFDKLIQWACGSPVTLDDGRVIVEDKKGSSGLRQGRVGVSGAYLALDNNKDVDLGDKKIPPLADFEHSIVIDEFGTFVSLDGIYGQYASGQEGRLSVFRISSTIIRFLVGSSNPSNVTIDFDHSSEPFPMTITIKRESGVFELLVNGDSKGTDNKPLINVYQGVNTTVANMVTNKMQGKVSEVIVDGYEANFQSGNQDTMVPFTNFTTNDTFYGEIQNADGADRVSTTRLASKIDQNGSTISRSRVVNRFNKAFANTANTFINSSGNEQGATDWYASDFTYIRDKDEFVFTGLTNLGGAFVAFFDRHLNFISSVSNVDVNANSGVIERPANAWFTRYSSREDVDSINDMQLQEGTVPTPYVAWDGYYYDQALTLPVPDGKYSQNVNGFTEWFITGGVKAPSEFTGLLKADLRVVDGVVDNGVGYEKWSPENANVIIGYSSIIMQGNGTGLEAMNDFASNIDNGGTYTTIIKVLSSTLGDNSKLRVLQSQVTSVAVPFDNCTVPGYGYATWIASNPTTGTEYEIQLRNSALAGEDIEYEVVGTFKGTITDISQVTLGEPVVGNSVIQATTRYDLIQADNLTTTDMFDTADIDNAVPLLVELTGDVQDNPLFIRQDPFCWLLYNEVLNATEEEQVEKYLGF